MAFSGIETPPPEMEPSFEHLRDVLAKLYDRQLSEAEVGYLTEHALPDALDGQIHTFRWYLPFVEHGSSFLDWGCHHGPDSALLREALGPEVRIAGCDLHPPGTYAVFHQYADLEYSEVGSTGPLPYASGLFDVVIASGVLEHVAADGDALRELHRVLADDGLLIISSLPNRLSIREFRLRRSSGGRAGHEKLYSRAALRDLLGHHGFRLVTPPLYQTFAWKRQAAKLLGHGSAAERLAEVLRTTLPVHVARASTLCAVAQRVTVFR